MNNPDNQWSNDGQIYYLEGYAWMVAPNGSRYRTRTTDEILNKHPVK